jgi:HEXXH motif-containing protein
MIGVIHLSEGYSGIRLSEAIVHEFHHNELFVLETTQKLSHHDQRSLFYSPWRSDPRPLCGLLHALHVFSAIVKFYRVAESTTDVNIDRGETHQRRLEFCQKLRIGILQVPQETLTLLGKGFLKEIEEDLVRHELELVLGPEKISDEVLSHARTWCRANPDRVQHLQWPGGVRELVG